MRFLLAISLTAIPAAAVAKDAPVPMPTCQGAEDCEVRWGRAVRWVMDHNPNIEFQNESLIRTGPAEVAGANQYQVTRIPDGEGRYTIDMKLGCANDLWGCKREKLKRDFSEVVGR